MAIFLKIGQFLLHSVCTFCRRRFCYNCAVFCFFLRIFQMAIAFSKLFAILDLYTYLDAVSLI